MIIYELPSVLLEVAIHDEHDLLFHLLHLLQSSILHSEHLEVVIQLAATQIQFLHLL